MVGKWKKSVDKYTIPQIYQTKSIICMLRWYFWQAKQIKNKISNCHFAYFVLYVSWSLKNYVKSEFKSKHENPEWRVSSHTAVNCLLCSLAFQHFFSLSICCVKSLIIPTTVTSLAKIPQHLNGKGISISFNIHLWNQPVRNLNKLNVALFSLHPQINNCSRKLSKMVSMGCKLCVSVEKNLPLLTGKSSMIFGSAIISTSCTLGAEHWENSITKADDFVVFLSVQACLCLFFQKLLRNFSVSESEAVFVCVAWSIHIWRAQWACQRAGWCIRACHAIRTRSHLSLFRVYGNVNWSYTVLEYTLQSVSI